MTTENGAKPTSLAAKLAAVMGAVGTIPKSGHNAHFGYDFVQEEDVSTALRGELARRNVIVVPSVLSRERQGNITVLAVELTFYDGDSDATIKSTVYGEGQDTQDKGSNKALTAAVKYGLLKTFLIASGDDPDRAGAPAPTPAPAPARSATRAPSGVQKKVDAAGGPTPVAELVKKGPIDAMALDTLVAFGRAASTKVRGYFYATWLPEKGYNGADDTARWTAFIKNGAPHYADAVRYFEQNAGTEAGS